ncbi:hypothetical protein [Novipirellula rosea]|uniref:Transposase IS66 C-terminal domain-containing protein n=1 Tax=Novipirellula rosea TaxID=1031540 RepID=A0ABP8MD69_9BACT
MKTNSWLSWHAQILVCGRNRWVHTLVAGERRQQQDLWAYLDDALRCQTGSKGELESLLPDHSAAAHPYRSEPIVNKNRSAPPLKPKPAAPANENQQNASSAERLQSVNYRKVFRSALLEPRFLLRS